MGTSEYQSQNNNNNNNNAAISNYCDEFSECDDNISGIASIAPLGGTVNAANVGAAA